jgi:hypothetical protein
MWEWLGKPLLWVAAILIVLGGISAVWLASEPTSVRAGEPLAITPHNQQVQQAIRDAESGR